jgi:hypothetical protein
VVPYAQQQTGIASRLFGGGGGYPQQQTAPFSPDQLAAMQGVEQLTPEQQAYLNQAQAQNAALAGGTPDISAATGALTGVATGQDPFMQLAQQSLAGLAGGQNQAINVGTQALQNLAAGQNPNWQQAMGAAQGMLNDPSIQAAQRANLATMQGQYLDPSQNKALQDYLNAGMAPIVANYQTAVAPNILSNAVATGGLGSSGAAEAFSNAQAELARSLGDYSAQVIEPAYQAERGLQQQAIMGAPGLLAPSQQAIGQMGSLLGQQAGAAQGLPGMLSPQLQAAQGMAGTLSPQLQAAGQIPGMYGPQEQAISQAGGLAQGAYMPSEQLMGVGTQQQQQLQNVLNTAFGNQMMPYQMSQMGANLISALSGGGGQSFQVSRQPGGSMK